MFSKLIVNIKKVNTPNEVQYIKVKSLVEVHNLKTANVGQLDQEES